MIFIIRALSQCGKDDEDYDSPTSRDETLDFTKRKKEKREKGQKEKKQAKEKKAKEKKEKEKNKMREKERRDNATICFSTLVLQKQHHDLHVREYHMLSLSYTSGNFSLQNLLVYSNDGLPQSALGLREQASWMHTTQFPFELSYTYNSSASVAWQSLLTHIDIY